MILFEDEQVTVSQGWLRGWRVLDKVTGRQLVPPRDIEIRMGFAWKILRHDMGGRNSLGRDAEPWLMRAFADACLDPSSDAARRFLDGRPSDTAAKMVDAVILSKTQNW